MANIKEARSLLQAAAAELRKKIRDLDEAIVKVHQQRNEVTGAPISKAEYIEYIKTDMQRMAKPFVNNITRHFKNKPHAFGSLEAMQSANGLGIQYLRGEFGPGVEVIDTSAFYFYFGDLVTERLSEILDQFEWSEDAIPVVDRPALLAKYDKEIAKLTAERDDLAKELLSAGLAP